VAVNRNFHLMKFRPATKPAITFSSCQTLLIYKLSENAVPVASDKQYQAALWSPATKILQTYSNSHVVVSSVLT